MDSEIQLNEEQKILILRQWDENPNEPPSISDLIKLIFPNAESFDGRTKHGRVIREFLAGNRMQAETSKFKAKGLIELSESQKEYIINNFGSMKSIEMARVLFRNDNLKPTSQESRSVFEFCKTLDPKILVDTDEEAAEDWKPPKTFPHVVARINKYKKDANFDAEKLTAKQRKQCQSLISYLHTYRFIHQINTYQNAKDQKLFESSFIKYTYDKEDLTEEDVDQYIILCSEVVISSNIQRTIDMLQGEQDRIVEEQGKMSMTLVEAINTARTEYNASIKRSQSLYKDLVHERSKRIRAEKEGVSIVTLVNLWKEETSRQDILKLANEKRQKLKEEIDRLASMEELKCRLLGISENELLNS